MPKTKAQKQETIKELTENFSKAKSVVFANIQGLKAKDLVVLRRRVKETKGILKVAKKTLIGLAVKNKKTEAEINPRQMTGEVVVLFGLEDPILPLKSLYNFSKDHENLKLIAGIFDNVLLGKEEVLAIAQLPSREEILSRLVGSVASPMSGFLNVLQGNIKGLIFALKAIANK